MTHALPPLTKDLIDAFAASAVAWAVRLLGVLVAPGAARRRSAVRRLLTFLERAVESIVFLWAVQRYGPAPRKTRRPRSVPRGFRRTMGNRRLFLKYARIRARGADAFARVARLLAALAHPERYIARFTRLFLRGVNFSHLVPCAPPAVAISADAPLRCAFADSS